jgi:predicted unusual protein kinase regulating ubiquinone biosynthesis (AarF/ABC1/UbiB family)
MAERKRGTTERSTPIGKIARTTVAGVTAAKIGAKKLELLSKRPFLSSESFQKRRRENDDEIAEILFRGLSQLRGTALKVAQMMSLELGILPEAYRRELYKSHYQVPALNRAVIRRIMIGEFGRPPEEIFEAFEPTAFAAASLGQVHKARARTGQELAVKVQYPGIGTALTNDIQMAKQFLLPFVRTEYLADATQELEHRLLEEIDYDLERKHTQWFHEHARSAEVSVPRTFDEYSSKFVLTTEFIEGVHLDRWLQTGPSQARRDRAAQAIYDFFMRSVFELHTMHGDPNPGNYLFRADGTIALIDFGAVKVFTPAFCKQILELWRAHIHDDLDKIIAYYCSLGLGRGDKKLAGNLCRQTLRPFGEWMSLPYQGEIFDFGKHPDFCDRGAKLFREILASREVMDGFTAETVMFDRNIYGLFRIFSELKARVRMKNRWLY